MKFVGNLSSINMKSNQSKRIAPSKLMVSDLLKKSVPFVGEKNHYDGHK